MRSLHRLGQLQRRLLKVFLELGDLPLQVSLRMHQGHLFMFHLIILVLELIVALHLVLVKFVGFFVLGLEVFEK